jgi:hypothetical protein
LLKPERLFVVRDTLEPLDGRPHSYEALWHLEVNAVDVDARTGIVETRDPGVNLRIVPCCTGELQTRIVKGQETPTVQGWMPLGHGIRGVRPIPTVVHACRSAAPVTLVTVFQPLQDDREDRVSQVWQAAGRIRIVRAGGRTIETPLPPPE